MVMLLNHRGEPVDTGRLTTAHERAEATLAGVRAAVIAQVSPGLTPERLAAILREAEDGDPEHYLALAEEMEERDLHYQSVLGTRKRQVAQLDVTVTAYSDDANDAKAAALCQELLDEELLADDVLIDMLDAVGKGFSICSIAWETSAREWRPRAIQRVEPRFVRFDQRTRSIPLLRTEAGDLPLDPWCFIDTRIKAKSGLPLRGGLARAAAWGFLFKQFSLKDWVVFSEAYGQPLRLGKYHAGATDSEKRSLLRAVASIGSDRAAIIPDAMILEFLEAKGTTASADLYDRMLAYLDRQVSKAVLGQTTTTDAISGGHAVSKEHDKVREDIERADAKALARVLRRDLFMPFVALNMGEKARCPRVKIGRPEEQDVDRMIDAAKTFVPMGLRVAAKDIYAATGLSVPEDADDLLTAPGGAPEEALMPGVDGPDPAPENPRAGRRSPPGGLSRAVREARPGPYGPYSPLNALDPSGRPVTAAQDGPDGPEPDPISTLAEVLDERTRAAQDALIDRIRDVFLQAQSFEEARGRITQLLRQPADAALADTLREAMVLAELFGRSRLEEGGDDGA